MDYQRHQAAAVEQDRPFNRQLDGLALRQQIACLDPKTNRAARNADRATGALPGVTAPGLELESLLNRERLFPLLPESDHLPSWISG
jgi:hypothetical protein